MSSNRFTSRTSIPVVAALLVIAGLACFLGRPNYPRSDRKTDFPKEAQVNAPNISTQSKTSPLPVSPDQISPDTMPEKPTRPLFHLLSRLEKPVILDLASPASQTPTAALKVNSSSLIAPDMVHALSSIASGSVIQFPTPEGSWLQATVSLAKFNTETGESQISGHLDGRYSSTFSVTQSGNSLSGLMLDRAKNRAFKIETALDGRVLLQEKPLNSVVCASMPKDPFSRLQKRQSGPVAAVTVPVLDSLPGAAHVLYLDFDGETVNDPLWPSEIDGSETVVALPATLAGQPISVDQITAVWDAVAEDFRPFKISVTTIRSRYDNAEVGERMRCIVTPTNDVAPGAGGVAYLNSFSRAGGSQFSDDIPCWSFNNGSVRDMVMTISHELGHTFGLSHDGLSNSEGTQEYYGGHGTGATSWGALMGAPFGRPVTQWSKGDYTDSNEDEDDLAIISGTANGFGYRDDDISNNTGTARPVSDLIFGVLNEPGVISSETDVDVHTFNSGAGPINVTVSPLTTEPNLDVILELLDSTGTVISTANSPATLTASISRTLTFGTYYLAIRRTGTGVPLDPSPTGYVPYGSLGGYRISGSFTPLPLIPTITLEPSSPPSAIVEGRPVSFSVQVISNSPVKYQWVKIVGGMPQNIRGATSSTYRIPAVNATHIADYKVIVSNKAGNVESQVVSLDVILKPRIVTNPASSVFAANSNSSLVSGISGTPPLTLQWFKNNQIIPGANSTSLDFTGVVWEDRGSYRLEVTNSVGKAVSKTAVVSVNSAPVFLSFPPIFAVANGGRATLSLPHVGSPRITYQWFKDDAAIPGATKSTLSLPGNPASLGVYKLQATNPFGVLTSNDVTVEVDDVLKITEHPLGLTGTAGGAHTFNVETTGSPPTNYDWQQNRRSIGAVSSKNLVRDPLTWFHNGNYRVVVSNRVSRVTSKEAALRISSAPVIMVEPQDLKGATGGSITFAVTAVGTTRLSYQWRKGGEPIAKAIGSKLTLSRLDSTSQGNYDVVVTNPINSTTSRSASLIVEDAPKITIQPQPIFVGVGEDLILSATASGAPTLSYKWQRGTRDIVGQTTSTLTIPNAQTTDTSSYRVVVSNDVGSATSKSAAVKVLIKPAIVTGPASLTVFETGTATFRVTLSGSGPFKYKWFLGATQVSTSSTLTLSNVRLDQAGNYKVEVTSPVGVVTSDDAVLTVSPVPSPAIMGFSPTQGPPGTKVAIFGPDLRFARSVTVANRPMSFVVVNDNELLATVPDPASSGLIRVTSRGSQPNRTATSTGAFTITEDPINDNFADSMNVTGTVVSSRTRTEDYTRELNEPFHVFIANKSAWWRWVAPTTGPYEMSATVTNVDPMLAVYTGNSLVGLRLIASNDDENPFLRSSLVTISAIKGTAYRIAIDDFRNTGGSTTLKIRQRSSRAPLASVNFEEDQGFNVGESVASKGPWQGDTNTTLVESNVTGQSARLGPTNETGNVTLQTWLPMSDGMSVIDKTVKSVFTSGVNLPSDATSSDTFAWTVYNSAEAPLLALVFHAATGSMHVINASGQVWPLEQTLVSGARPNFEITTDLVRQTWSLSFEGVTLFDGNPLGITNETPDFHDLSASWSPDPEGPPASMVLDDIDISIVEP